MVIDPSVKSPELDSFNRLSARSPVPLTYHLPAFYGMESVRRDELGAIGIIVLGSASSVHDRLPWQLELGDWLRAAMLRQVPTLGICFGHQLIAHLLGGQVGFLYPDQRKVTGFHETAIVALWGRPARSGSLCASHREVVTSCPEEMFEISTRPGIPFDGLAHRTLPVWTIQTHPEATSAFAPGEPAQFEFGHAFVDDFVRYVAERT